MSEGESQATPPVPVLKQEKEVSVKEVIQEQAPDILEGIPPEKLKALAQIKIEKHEFSMRASPLPDPSELAAYNQIIPNGADRILKMAEAQSQHRMAMERTVVKSQQTQGFCGQLFGLLVAICALLCATFAAVHGQPWFGSIIGGATLVSIVSAFLYSRHAQKRELSEKQLQTLPQRRQPQDPKKKLRNQ